MESSGEERTLDIPHRRGERGERKEGGDGGEVFIVMFVSVIPSPGSHEEAAENVARSNASEIATIAHKQRVNKQSATWWMTVGGQRRRGGNRREWVG